MKKNQASGEKPIKMHGGESKWAMFESKPTLGADMLPKPHQAQSRDCAIITENEWKNGRC